MIDLNTPAAYLHWWVIQISVPNLIVITLMVAVFLAALVVPIPSRGGEHARATRPAPSTTPPLPPSQSDQRVERGEGSA